jgi:methionyl-tRNA formyltransferase
MKEEAALDFTQSAEVIAREIRAFNPFPGAYAVFNGMNIKIWQAEVLPTINDRAGKVVTAHANEGIIVACGKGGLRLMELQKPGGKRLSAIQFLQGFSMQDGQFA